jgi:hypothetical protein
MLPLSLYFLEVRRFVRKTFCTRSFTSHVCEDGNQGLRQGGRWGGAVVSPPWVTESKEGKMHIINEDF